MSASKDRGTRWETVIVRYLQACGWPHAERRALAGVHDRGDVAGVAGVCVEAKSTARLDLAGFLTEAEREGRNASARVAVAWIKRRGKASAEDGYVVMSGATFTALLADAGYR